MDACIESYVVFKFCVLHELHCLTGDAHHLFRFSYGLEKNMWPSFEYAYVVAVGITSA